MKARFVKDGWYPFYVEVDSDWPSYKDTYEYEITEADLNEYRLAKLVLSNLFDKLEKQDG